ncbi:hypothetical protein J7M28_03100 [bacterium]|nr:hypothetical protein [bacterium]
MFLVQRIAVILFGVLVIGARLPGVIAPGPYKAWIEKHWFGKHKWLDVFAVLAITAGIQVLAFLWEASTLTGVLAIIFGFAMLGVAILAFISGAPREAMRRFFIDKLFRNDNVCRALCLVGVLVGLGIVIVAILGL